VWAAYLGTLTGDALTGDALTDGAR
jgi:hypothetical protein